MRANAKCPCCGESWNDSRLSAADAAKERAEKERDEAERRRIEMTKTTGEAMIVCGRELEKAQAESATLREKLAEMDDLLEEAWGVIANAGGGDWSNETNDWQHAAARWRDHWHYSLAEIAALSDTKDGKEGV